MFPYAVLNVCVAGTLRQQALEEMCSSLRADNSTLSEQLAEVRTELSEHRQREAEVDAAQASLQARKTCM